MDAPPEGLLSVRDAARRLGRSEEQVRRYLREGRVEGKRLGGQWFVIEASMKVPNRQAPSTANALAPSGDLGGIGSRDNHQQTSLTRIAQEVASEEAKDIGRVLVAIRLRREAIFKHRGQSFDLDHIIAQVR